MYSIRTESGHGTFKVKGCSSKDLDFNRYNQVMNNSAPTLQTGATMESKQHSIATIEKTKIELTAFDDKRYILDDSVHTLPYGHYSL